MASLPVAESFFVSGGTLPRDSASYIERRSDAELFNSLRAGRYCYVLNTRQMGKSSLSVRTMGRLVEQGVRTAFVDLTQIGGRNVTADQWYAGLAGELGRALGLRAEMLGYFRDHASTGAMQRLFGALREVALQRIEDPIVVFIDEIDATRNLSFDTDEFFAGIRECFNRRVHDPVYKRLTFCLLGVAVPSDLIANSATTPFNIGERIQLEDFTAAELDKYGPILGPDGGTLVRRVHFWTSGQPFLTQSLCQTIANERLATAADVDALVERMFFGPKSRDTNINLADVANRALNDSAGGADPERFRADLLSAYERAWRGAALKDDESNRVTVVLKLSGLMRSNGSKLVVRNRIYRRVFDREWIEANMPGQETLRLRQSFRRGLFRATAASVVIVGVVGALAIVAWRAQREAVAAKAALDYELYVADMNSMRLFEESGDIARMQEVLERTKSSPHRGFEWGFWVGRLHDATEEYTLNYAAPGKREDGVLSLDGQQLCLVDQILSGAAIIDRRTKRAIAFTKIRGQVVATSNGFLDIEIDSPIPRIKDVKTGHELGRLGVSGEELATVVVAEQSNYAVASITTPAVAKGRDRLVVYDLRTLRPTFEWRQPGFDLHARGVSADGSRVAVTVAGSGREEVVVLDTALGTPIDRFSVKVDTVPRLSASGRFLVYTDEQMSWVMRDVAKGKIVFSVPNDPDNVPLTTSISADDRQLISVYPDGRATVTAIPSRERLALRRSVWSAQPSIQSLLIGGSTSVRLLNSLESTDSVTLTRGHRVTRNYGGKLNVLADNPRRIEWVTDPDLRPAGKFVVPTEGHSLTYNGRWFGSTEPGERSMLLRSVANRVPPLRLSPPPLNFSRGTLGDPIATVEGGGRTVSGVSATTGKRLWMYRTGAPVSSIWVSPDGSTVLASLEDTSLLAIDSRTGGLRARLETHNLKLANLTFTLDQNHFLTCGADGRALLWDLRTLRKVREFRGNAAQRVSGADLSPDGTRVATCNLTGAWQLWDVRTGAQLMDIRGSTRPLRSIAFTSDSRKILTAGEDHHVRVWSSVAQDPTVRIDLPQTFAEELKRSLK